MSQRVGKCLHSVRTVLSLVGSLLLSSCVGTHPRGRNSDRKALQTEPQACDRFVSACRQHMVFVPGQGASNPDILPGRTGAGEACYHHSPSESVDCFCIDEHEVTVAAYRACVEAGSCALPGPGPSYNYLGADLAHSGYSRPSECFNMMDYGRNDLPISCIDHDDAEAYCLFVHKRLPTLPEWEFAARGPDWRPFPWGNAPPRESDDINFGSPTEARREFDSDAVGVHRYDKSPFGALDMLTGVREWTASRMPSRPRALALDDDSGVSAIATFELPRGRERDFYAVAGQSWFEAFVRRDPGAQGLSAFPSLCSYITHHAQTRGELIGLRCATSVRH